MQPSNILDACMPSTIMSLNKKKTRLKHKDRTYDGGAVQDLKSEWLWRGRKARDQILANHSSASRTSFVLAWRASTLPSPLPLLRGRGKTTLRPCSLRLGTVWIGNKPTWIGPPWMKSRPTQ
jgi:hypothetical protein